MRHVRRGRAAMLAATLALGITVVAASVSSGATSPLAKVKHIVIIYEESHSFDNLYGGWEGVNGVAKAQSANTTQVSQAGTAFACLLQNDVNLTSPPQPADCSDSTTAKPFTSHFKNAPFTI